MVGFRVCLRDNPGEEVSMVFSGNGSQSSDTGLSKEYPFVAKYIANIIESAMDAIITVDEGQRIVLFNAAAESVFGCPRERAIGEPLTMFIPSRFQATHGDHIRRFGESGVSSRRMSGQRIVMALRCNGEEFPIEASISHVHQDGKRFFTVILRDVTERVQAEAALLESKEELQKLALAAHSVREQEKTRIARELHDELGQALTALKMDLVWLQQKLPDATETLKNKLFAMENLLNVTVAATRRISADLRPLMLDDLGLAAALEWLTQNFIQHTGLSCALHVDDSANVLHDLHATAIFRIVQESLTNISKHANASSVEIRVEQLDGVMTLYIHDDGVGFVVDAPRKPNSYGLLGLRERAYLLGGTIEMTSAPGQGTTILVQLPITAVSSEVI